ncbi:RNA-directed DNA polymerase [Raphanus sativus]|nr:RNA-directed DNA polymerase [Raphanus sativus]
MDPSRQGQGFNSSRSKRSATSKHPVLFPPFPEVGSDHRLGKTISNKSAITFSPYENVELDMPHDDALIITIELAGVVFSKVLTDSGCVANLLSHDTLEKINRPDLAVNKYAPPPLQLRRWKQSTPIREYSDHH